MNKNPIAFHRGLNRRGSRHWVLRTYFAVAVIIFFLIFFLIGFGGYFSNCQRGDWFCFAGDPGVFLIGLIAGALWPIGLIYLLFLVVTV